MTHEKTEDSEAEGGPENTASLPDATDIPVADGPFNLEPTMWPEHWEGD